MVHTEAEGGHRRPRTGRSLGPDLYLTGPVGNSDLLRRRWVGGDIRCHIMGAEGGEEVLPQSR